MFYFNLKEIIKHIEEKVSCAGCSEKFQGKKLEILYLHGSKVAVVAHCAKCNTSTTIIVSEEAPKARSITIQKRANLKGKKIEMNDVLDMRSYINNFQGSFRDLLK